MSVSLVARQHGIAPNQLFRWRRLYTEGALSAVSAGEEVVAASEYRALQHQVRELQRLLGKKTLENSCGEALALSILSDQSNNYPGKTSRIPAGACASPSVSWSATAVISTRCSSFRCKRNSRLSLRWRRRACKRPPDVGFYED
jgi:hypothetical protein